MFSFVCRHKCTVCGHKHHYGVTGWDCKVSGLCTADALVSCNFGNNPHWKYVTLLVSVVPSSPSSPRPFFLPLPPPIILFSSPSPSLPPFPPISLPLSSLPLLFIYFSLCPSFSPPSLHALLPSSPPPLPDIQPNEVNSRPALLGGGTLPLECRWKDCWRLVSVPHPNQPQCRSISVSHVQSELGVHYTRSDIWAEWKV